MAETDFSRRQLAVLNRIGDLLLPANGEFPAFSQTGALVHLNEITDASHPDDIRDLRRVLDVMSVMPDSVLRRILRSAMAAHGGKRPWSPLLRQLDIGFRGIIYSLYYAGLHGAGEEEKVLRAMAYQTQCEPDRPSENSTFDK